MAKEPATKRKTRSFRRQSWRFFFFAPRVISKSKTFVNFAQLTWKWCLELGAEASLREKLWKWSFLRFKMPHSKNCATIISLRSYKFLFRHFYHRFEMAFWFYWMQFRNCRCYLLLFDIFSIGREIKEIYVFHEKTLNLNSFFNKLYFKFCILKVSRFAIIFDWKILGRNTWRKSRIQEDIECDTSWSQISIFIKKLFQYF